MSDTSLAPLVLRRKRRLPIDATIDFGIDFGGGVTFGHEQPQRYTRADRDVEATEQARCNVRVKQASPNCEVVDTPAASSGSTR